MRFLTGRGGPGTRQETQEHLTTATATYREMGMGFWLAQAEVAMGEAG